jgi:hypothetical protein
VVPGALGGAAFAELGLELAKAVVEFGPFKTWVSETFVPAFLDIGAGHKVLDIQSRAATLQLLLKQQENIEAATGPLLLKFASAGLKDFLGVEVPPEQLGLHGGGGGRRAAADTIGKHVLGAMFAAFGQPAGITPAGGRENAEKLVSAVIETALEGWLGSNLSLGYITSDLPDWGDLDDVMARNLGMGRITARVLRPIVQALIVDPFTQYLNLQLRPQLLSESEATRAVNRGSIDEETYFDVMGRHGHARGQAAELRQQHSQQLSRSDLQALYDRRLLTAADVLQHLRAQGFSEGVAEGVLRLIQDDRVSSLHSALATIARDMFRDGEIDESETRQLLDTIGYSAEEKDALLAVARIERSRPRHVSAATMEQAYKLELIDVDALAAYYARERYAAGDVELLVTLAVREKQAADERAADRKLGRPPHLTDADYAEFHRRGIIDSAALRAALLGLRLDPPAVDLLVAQAVQRRAEYVDAQRRRVRAAAGVRVTRGTIEEAFIRGLVPEAQLVSAYQEAGFPGPDVNLLLVLRREERAEFLARQASGAATSHT